MSYKKDWGEYYKLTKSKPPRPLLLEAFTYVKHKDRAIDIGAGALRDTRYLLEQGFEVVVIDKSPMVCEEVENLKNDKLRCEIVSFEDFKFPKSEFDFVAAMYSLPFCQPQHFDRFIRNVKGSLRSGGVFCGQFFGNRDGWADNPEMAFHTLDSARRALEDLSVVKFVEEEVDDKTASGEVKHWHVFHFIATKK